MQSCWEISHFRSIRHIFRIERSKGLPSSYFMKLDGGRLALESTRSDGVGDGRSLAERLALDNGLRARLGSYAWRRFGIPPEDVADILQETCLSLLYSRARIEYPEGFALAVFHGRCCSAIGARVKARGTPPRPEEVFGDRNPVDSIWLRDAVARLSPRRRALIREYFFAGHNLKETARLCGIAEASAWTLLNRSVVRLREEMAGRTSAGARPGASRTLAFPSR